jgi:hypothetical protein
VTPNAIPSAPSTSCANSPTKKKSHQVSSNCRPCDQQTEPDNTEGQI